jgi:putative glycosyltransferase
MKLSIVTTLFYSSKFIEEFNKRITVQAKKLFPNSFEIIYVNDGSPDNSLEIVKKIHLKDDYVKIIDLSRNFGHHKAIMTGLKYATGDYVYLLDSDLEDQPEWLPIFFSSIKKTKSDVSYGQLASRYDPLLKRMSGNLFHYLFNFLSGYKGPINSTTARLMTKKYVQALTNHCDYEIFLPGLWSHIGFKQSPVSVEKPYKGETTYSFLKKINLAINAITSFSNKPLVITFYFGLFVFLISLVTFLVLIHNWIFYSKPMLGWTSIFVSLWLIGGLIIFFIGVVGLYLSKIYLETKKRPITVIKNLYGKFPKILEDG